ncbi:Calcitonin gene-related peptide [Merluccius polli]|uniref:Calcitonin gene-related peptide n=1 Tax=Merluccius polli TaxID=89951 RepID=A0AA47NQF8_MERPO|nr:Calcitonin gene-related peptide [Merluccius polli]
MYQSEPFETWEEQRRRASTSGHWSADFNGLTSCTVHLSPCVWRAQPCLLSADGANRVRHGLQGHAQFGSESWHRSWRELEMKPLEHRATLLSHWPGRCQSPYGPSLFKHKHEHLKNLKAKCSSWDEPTGPGFYHGIASPVPSYDTRKRFARSRRYVKGVGGRLGAGDDELAHRVDEVLPGVRRAGVPGTLLQLVQVGVHIVARGLGHPALREAVDHLLQEAVHLRRVAEQLLVLPEGQVLDPGEGVVEEGPAAHGQLHVLAEELDHVLEVVVVVREALAEDDEVGDVGNSVGHQVLGVEGLALVLVHGVHEEHALLRDLPLEQPLATPEEDVRLRGQGEYVAYDRDGRRAGGEARRSPLLDELADQQQDRRDPRQQAAAGQDGLAARRRPRRRRPGVQCEHVASHLAPLLVLVVSPKNRDRAWPIGSLVIGTMLMLKLSTVLLAYALVSIQKPSLHAAPPRAAETDADRVSLVKHSAQKLLDAIVQEFMHTTSAEHPQHTTKGNGSVTAEKRACNTATCVTHRLADYLSRSGGTGNRNFVRTNVGAQAFGRRKRHNPL